MNKTRFVSPLRLLVLTVAVLFSAAALPAVVELEPSYDIAAFAAVAEPDVITITITPADTDTDTIAMLPDKGSGQVSDPSYTLEGVIATADPMRPLRAMDLYRSYKVPWRNMH